ncbi:SUN domain-containing protein 1 [Dirofilaria immitis]|nr:SUN domain-containing protein 1 [Dirofilaria immitis]
MVSADCGSISYSILTSLFNFRYLLTDNIRKEYCFQLKAQLAKTVPYFTLVNSINYSIKTSSRTYQQRKWEFLGGETMEHKSQIETYGKITCSSRTLVEPTIGNSNLTQSDLNRLLDLDDTYRTDYTYVTSKSYRLNGSDDYINPRMSRLPLSYYRRKWAFEKARECLWYIINRIFPNPEYSADVQGMQLKRTTGLQEHEHSIRKREKQNKQENEFQPPTTPNRETIWHIQTMPSDSLVNRLRQLFAKMIMFDYLSRSDIQGKIIPRKNKLDHRDDFSEHKWQGRSSFIPVDDLTHNVRRRVRTNSYEYSEDRGPEVDNQSIRAAKLSRGLVESLFFRLFYFTFVAVLSPVKILELTIEEVARFFRSSSNSTYDLRSRTVHKTPSLEETLPYCDRFANFMSEITTSYPYNKLLEHQHGTNTTHFYKLFVFYQSFCSCTTGFILFLVSLQSIPFYIAENIRERVWASSGIANRYEEVRPVKRKGFTSDLNSPTITSQRKMIHTVVCNKSQLFPTRSSLKRSSVFWKWLFPLLVLLLVMITLHKRHDGKYDLVNAMEQFDKIQRYVFDERGLNFVRKNALYLVSFVFRFLNDLLFYPAKLYGAMIYPQKTIEQVVQLPKYVYIAGQSKDTKAITNACSYNFFIEFRAGCIVLVPVCVASFSKCPLFQSGFKRCGHDLICLEINKFCIANCFDFAIIFHFDNQPFYGVCESKTKSIISSDSLNQQQSEWTLEHLRHEKESSLVNNEFFRHRNDDFPNYMANLRRKEDEELRKELSELSIAVGNLRNQFDKLRREKEAKIAQFAHSIISRDIKRSDDLDTLKAELNKKLRMTLIRLALSELAFSLSRFERTTHEEREAFRLEIMKMVENRVVTLFANHVTEKNDADSETKLTSVLGLSESDFTVIRKMITDALDTYDADKTGKVDYALESSGASVVSTRCTEPYKENSRLESIFGIPLWYSSYSPRAVIQHRPLAAGECWAFRGKGYLTIKLSHPIYVTEVSYEHLHSTLHPDGVLRSAPKLLQSYKAVDDLKSKSLIGQYEYDIKGRALQTFHIQSRHTEVYLLQNEINMPVSIIELVVQSNWDSDYTCLYRFRVHGRKA